jgi:hypothetical protein
MAASRPSRAAAYSATVVARPGWRAVDGWVMGTSVRPAADRPPGPARQLVRFVL